MGKRGCSKEKNPLLPAKKIIPINFITIPHLVTLRKYLGLAGPGVDYAGHTTPANDFMWLLLLLVRLSSENLNAQEERLSTSP